MPHRKVTDRKRSVSQSNHPDVLAIEELCVEQELENVRRYRASLEPVDPAYLESKEKANDEICRLTVKLDRVREQLYYYLPRARREKATTKDRDARLQRRFNELYTETGSKKQACHKLAGEEQQRSNVSFERLMTIMRVPRLV